MDIISYWHDIRKYVDNNLIKKISILNIIYIIAVFLVSSIVTMNAIMVIYYFLLAQIFSVSVNYLFWILWTTRASIERRLKMVAVPILLVGLTISITILLWGGTEALNFL